MKTPLKTKVIVAANLIAVVAIVSIILLHNFQASGPVEQEVLSVSKNVERAPFNPATDQNDLESDDFAALFEEEDSDEEKDEEKDEESEEVEDETAVEEDTDETVAGQGEVDDDNIYSYDSTKSQQNNSQTQTENNSSEGNSTNQPSSSKQPSTDSSGSNNNDSNHSNNSPSNESKNDPPEPEPVDCKWTQTEQNGECVNRSYSGLVQSSLSPPFSAEGSNPVTIKYDGVEFATITPGQVVGDGEIEKGEITQLGGENYTEDRKNSLLGQLSGLLR